MAKQWTELSTEEFFALAATPEAMEIANRHHAAIYSSGEHSSFHSCACSHIAVQELLDRESPKTTWPETCPTCGAKWQIKSKTMGAHHGQPHQGRCANGHWWNEQ